VVSLRRILLLAYHFPPDPSIGGARPFRFYKHLPAAGWQPHVITAAPQSGSDRDPSITAVPDPFLSKSTFSFSWQLERLVRKLWIPGHRGTVWAYSAAAAAQQWIQSDRRNTILLTTAPPLGVLLAGLMIKRRTGIPWIADFRDPMAPLHGSSATIRYIERLTLERADRVIVNTDALADRWREIYPKWAHKISVLWNGYDPEDGISTTPWRPGECRKVCHVGALYGGRTPDILVRSVERLLASGRLPNGSVNITLVGPTDHRPFEDPKLLERTRRAGWLNFSEQSVSQQQARLLCQESDVLLLLQPQSDHQVPAKLFEYVRYGRPILAVVPPRSSVEELLALSGVPYRCVYPQQSVQEIDSAVLEVLTMPSAKIAVSDRFAQMFSARPQAEQLARFLDGLIPPA
jgi:glycosyltransferase involved in cell wall biosynthesis